MEQVSWVSGSKVEGMGAALLQLVEAARRQGVWAGVWEVQAWSPHPSCRLLRAAISLHQANMQIVAIVVV